MTTIPVVNEWRAVLPELVEPSDDCVDADEFSYEDEAVHAASPFLCRLSRRCQRAGPFAPDSPVEERDSNSRSEVFTFSGATHPADGTKGPKVRIHVPLTVSPANLDITRAAAGSTAKSPRFLAPADQVAEREPNQAGGQHSGEGFLRGILADVLS
jgi:hypothetical protein